MTVHDCCSPAPAFLVSVEEARELLMKSARPLIDTESVPTAEALGRVLAVGVRSGIDVPPWDNSAMDGYAVRTADLGDGLNRLSVTQRIPAGQVGDLLAPGTAARIFTGAPVPPGADAVVIQEVCESGPDWVRVPLVPVGANIRRAGEDIQRGQEVIPPGTRLLPQHLGLAASVGLAQIPVFRRLKVAVLSSGDELRLPGDPLEPGQIYNSNQFTLIGLLQGLGCAIQGPELIPDSLDATCDALLRAASQADLVVASGGVSVGEEDHLKPAVDRLGSLGLWKIAIRPGKPLAFGQIGETPFIGMPGNPVSVFITFCLFARPFIQRLQGIGGEVMPRPLQLPADFDWPRPDKRREYVRAQLVPSDEGRLCLQVYPSRSSGVLSSVTWASGLAVIPEGHAVARGELVDYLPFSELLS